VKRVTCAGECMLELSHIDARTMRLGFAGDTYNTAVYLRRVAAELGLPVEVGYVSGLGIDEYSAAMRAEWREQSIVDRSITVADRVPGIYAIHASPDGERSFTYWRDRSAAAAVFGDTSFCEALTGDLVHLSGITLQLISAHARDALVDRLRELRLHGTTVSFDTNYRPAGWSSRGEAADALARVCREADIVLTGREDEDLLHGATPPEAAVHRLAGLGVREVVLRAGADGAYLATDGVIRAFRAEPVGRVIDTTAAGDAFAGAYLAARLQSRSPGWAATIANTVASIVIQHPGAIVAREVPLSNLHPTAGPLAARRDGRLSRDGVHSGSNLSGTERN
jgi:2-dehydro-3-deoxygluconokinase